MGAMRAGSSSLRSTSWLAILAMALNALWPLIASARPTGAASFVEICTAQGLKQIVGDPATGPAGPGGKHMQLHCPICSYGTDKFSALTSAPLFNASATGSDCEPAVADASAKPHSNIRSPAYPRAPPDFS
jgi:Protein of unknown function (DUF2946)